MSSDGKPKGQAPRRVGRPAPAVSTGGKVAIWLSILGVAGILALVGLVVARSSGCRAAAPPPEVSGHRPQKPAPKPKAKLSPEEQAKADEEWLAQFGPQERPEKSPRRTLRERIEAEYEAAKRRVELYVSQGRWADAIAALERVMDRYNDEELWSRAEPEAVELRRQANRAFKAKLAEADKLAAEGRVAEARKTLESIAAFGIEDFTAQAKERIKQLAEREDAEAAAHYAQAIGAIDAMLPSWRFEEALATGRKLKFDRPHYQELAARRVKRIEELAALKGAIIEAIVNAKPRLDKRTLGVPGHPGELSVADAQFIHTVTRHGVEKIAWERLGPEPSARLALLAGNAKDPNHALAVARLLIELGHLDRAKEELDKARQLGAQTAADEADLARRQAVPPAKK
ncbi:MAG: hypothetical protein FJ290_08240 [Planctomycetes bacterium]|nr:hypothetical protein [Planctomycetota bacterium]